MDIQADKLSLIEWIAGINDRRIIRQFKSLQNSNQEKVSVSLTSAEKSAIDQGLKSIDKGQVHTHESVKDSTKRKYPKLFK
jgi:predicted transcriptional regulator